MGRAVRMLLALGVAGLAALPFLTASLEIDRRGVPVSGRVEFKHENLRIHYSSWTRENEVVIRYTPPDLRAGTLFMGFFTDPDEYDSFHIGQPVALRYLLEKDTPAVPLAGFWRQIHALPVARLEGRNIFSPLTGFVGRYLAFFRIAVLVLVVLVCWRIFALPRFGWLVAICVVVALAAILVDQFPLPTPEPRTDVLRATGKVTSATQIDSLFEGSRSHGMEAAQPVIVAGIEFTPAGRTEPVLAIDLIDDGSLPGLKEGALLPILYESRSPRVAHLENATRLFPRRNLRGIAVGAAVFAAVALGLLMAGQLIGSAFRRLLRRRP